MKNKSISLGGEDAEEVFEVYSLSHWLKMHLDYLLWYYNVACHFETSLEVLLEPPIVPLSVRRSIRYLRVFRYGLLCRAYDWVRAVSAPMALESFSCNSEVGVSSAGETLL